jgi:hypothetical protein
LDGDFLETFIVASAMKTDELAQRTELFQETCIMKQVGHEWTMTSMREPILPLKTIFIGVTNVTGDIRKALAL